MAKIEVHGYQGAGPIYTISTYRQGRRYRRNRWSRLLVGKRGGRNTTAAAHQFVHHGGKDYIIFNKGHEYEAQATIEGVDFSLVIDAVDDYAVVLIAPGVEYGDITPIVAAPRGADDSTTTSSDASGDEGDDEDAAPNKQREVGSDEEE